MTEQSAAPAACEWQIEAMAKALAHAFDHDWEQLREHDSPLSDTWINRDLLRNAIPAALASTPAAKDKP